MPPKRKREHSGEAPSDAESTASSPQDDSTLPKASKDRECPFCHQAFTSSSLGRHLDLYIRPVNPKRPDGIHNVDEIRRIRGNITRRQPKGSGKSSKERDTGGDSSVQDVRSDTGEVDDRRHDIVSRQLPKPSHLVNGMDWRATGVINEIRSTPALVGMSAEHTNGRTPGPQLPPMDTRSPSTRLQEDTMEEQIETGRAAELALREVLESLAAARREHDSTALFDGVDLCTLSYPAICLTVLPPPRTLFSTTPFADAESFDLRPPTEREKHMLEAAFDRLRMSRRVYDHVAAAFEQWSRLDEQERTMKWTTEVLRAFSKAKSTADELRTQLSLARQRVVHLENEYELLSRCQLPRERLLNPPATVPITKATLEHFAVEGTTEGLIDKWRNAIRTVAKPKKPAGTLSRMNNYADSAIRSQNLSKGNEPGTMELSADMIMHGAVFGVEGPMSRADQFPRPTLEVIPYGKPTYKDHVPRMVDNG